MAAAVAADGTGTEAAGAEAVADDAAFGAMAALGETRRTGATIGSIWRATGACGVVIVSAVGGTCGVDETVCACVGAKNENPSARAKDPVLAAKLIDAKFIADLLPPFQPTLDGTFGPNPPCATIRRKA